MAKSTRALVFSGVGRPLEIESLFLDEPQRGEVLGPSVANNAKYGRVVPICAQIIVGNTPLTNPVRLRENPTDDELHSGHGQY